MGKSKKSNLTPYHVASFGQGFRLWCGESQKSYNSIGVMQPALFAKPKARNSSGHITNLCMTPERLERVEAINIIETRPSDIGLPDFVKQVQTTLAESGEPAMLAKDIEECDWLLL